MCLRILCFAGYEIRLPDIRVHERQVVVAATERELLGTKTNADGRRWAISDVRQSINTNPMQTRKHGATKRKSGAERAREKNEMIFVHYRENPAIHQEMDSRR